MVRQAIKRVTNPAEAPGDRLWRFTLIRWATRAGVGGRLTGHRMDIPRPRAARLAARVLLLLAAATAGCNWAGWVAHGFSGHQTENVKAQYTQLDHHSIAVMVSATDATLSHYPQAPYELSRAVSKQLADHLKDVQLMSPKDVIQFEDNNPYWMAMRYSTLVKKMHVDRLVIIDLLGYQTHTPGDTHVWKGLVDATVGVVSADAKDPDNFVYYKRLRIEYPPDTTVGIVNADNQTMQLGMDALFSREAAWLFYNHQETRK